MGVKAYHLSFDLLSLSVNRNKHLNVSNDHDQKRNHKAQTKAYEVVHQVGGEFDMVASEKTKG